MLCDPPTQAPPKKDVGGFSFDHVLFSVQKLEQKMLTWKKDPTPQIHVPMQQWVEYIKVGKNRENNVCHLHFIPWKENVWSYLTNVIFWAYFWFPMVVGWGISRRGDRRKRGHHNVSAWDIPLPSAPLVSKGHESYSMPLSHRRRRRRRGGGKIHAEMGEGITIHNRGFSRSNKSAFKLF